MFKNEFKNRDLKKRKNKRKRITKGGKAERTQTYRHETGKGFAQHRKKGEKDRARDNYHSRSTKVTREAAEGGVQPGIIVGRHAILKRGTRGDFVNARRYLTIYRSLNKLLAQPVELITAIPLDPPR